MAHIFDFDIIFPAVIFIWFAGLIVFYSGKQQFNKLLGNIFFGLGFLLLVALIIYLWINLQRPPLKTSGETRLWYSVFVPFVGFTLYYRWKMRWLPAYSIILASVFVLINYFEPENFDKTLMPALQSDWFVPHVVVYMFAYSILTVSMLIAIKALYIYYTRHEIDKNLLTLADNVVYIGFAFLSFGLLFGAFWAKEAWGTYWSWDPKETWSLISWLFYLLYIHLRYKHKQSPVTALWVLALSFVILLICWFGVNYLPSASDSVHRYST